MSTTIVDINELRDRFAEIVAQANAGDEIILTDGSIPRAKLVALPIPQTQSRKLGLHPGAFDVSDDFDAPLPDDFWTGES